MPYNTGMAKPKIAAPSSEQTAAGRRQDESAYVTRVAHVLAKASEVLGDQEKAAHWLQSSNSALLGDKPVDRLGTDAGMHSVLEILGRIAYGLYS